MPLEDNYSRNRYGLTEAQRADQAFLEAARKRSPKFPDLDALLEKRRCAREALAARTLMATFAAGVIYGIGWNNFGWVVAGFSLVGFTITCFVAGNRQYKRSGGDSAGHRPF